ncbi:MAG: family 78 glycoside hydrolase catalytic domain [Anaerolineae bacterium]
MKITHLKTNHISNPLGYAIPKPTFSWIVDDTLDTVQTAARFQMSLDTEFNMIVFDSGKIDGNGIDSVAYTPPLDTLQPRTRYYWQVEVWGESEHAQSPIAWFETGKMDEAWQATWITPAWDDPTQHPILHKAFELPEQAVSARAYLCGLGLYHFELNGQKVGDELFTPYCNAYDKWLQYQTFDLTDNLAVGNNQIAVMLGNGWYKGRYGGDRGVVGFYGDQFALICEIHITFENGETLIVNSDLSWQATPSPVLESDIFDGERYDARLEQSAELSAVRALEMDTALLEARRSLPVRIMEEIQPIALIETPAGETVLDMGQNMTGWLRFKTSAPAGTEIHLQFGEVLQDGNFFRENLRTARAEYFYTADGREDVRVEPYFTFFGFRYVKISGWVGELNLHDFVGCVIYSDMDIIGELETSNEKVNQLIQNVLWGQKGNFLDIPTDCPQRDERLGWTGDIQVFLGTACFNMDVSAFLSKYAYDLGYEQAELDGIVPHTVPMVNMMRGGSTAWADVATILPWNLYEFYGDVRILDQQFESMCAWVDHIHRIDESTGSKRLWTEGVHFGDWLSLDAPDPTSRRGGTPHDFIASAFYCYSAHLVAKAAQVLDKPAEATHYAHLSAEVKTAIQEEYFTATGRLAIPTQTGYVLALFMDLVPPEHRARVQQDFIARLHADNNHLKTGFVGTPYLCRVLSNNGANDLAYQLLLNEDYPSWLYAVNLDATTIWERWNSLNPDGSISSTSMNSFNHYAYGSIVEWLYRDVCGLNPAMTTNGVTGFRHARIAPKPHPSLSSARARYRSINGYYESAWHIDDAGQVRLELVIPFNASAEVMLTDVALADVALDGQAIPDAQQTGDDATFMLGAGHYRINYPLTHDLSN